MIAKLIIPNNTQLGKYSIPLKLIFYFRVSTFMIRKKNVSVILVEFKERNKSVTRKHALQFIIQ